MIASEENSSMRETRGKRIFHPHRRTARREIKFRNCGMRMEAFRAVLKRRRFDRKSISCWGSSGISRAVLFVAPLLQPCIDRRTTIEQALEISV